jgi:hypothetical protein
MNQYAEQSPSRRGLLQGTGSLRRENDIVRCPSGTGFGVTIDPDFMRKAEEVK